MKVSASTRCNRVPEGYGANKTPADGRFHIRITDDTNKYEPGKTYTIMLEGIDSGVKGQGRPTTPLRYKFTGFMLVVERKSNESGYMTEDFSSTEHGVFTLSHADTYSKLTCGNMVTHSTSTPKSEIQVLWTAPQAGSGCVNFRATVIEHRDVWYMDDGPLTKEFCEDEQSLDDLYTLPMETCCACTEAKYELTFEGLWSRNTHPRDFPQNVWVTRFGDIIGASHAIGYKFWKLGDKASEGLQEVAERGTTRTLETELKNNSQDIRTIIKARGLSYPNVTGKTFAVFRVDSTNHLMSFVSMIDPSPDWFVGVSGLELCLSNCSWIETKEIELFPWDAGTDSGITYTSPNQPTNPKDDIRRIKADYPNDVRSPFYDPEGLKMKPLARLTLLRQRLYEKNCPSSSGDDISKISCKTTKWGSWSKCNSKCGPGLKLRQRDYVNPEQANHCNKELTDKKECHTPCENDNSDVEDITEASCALTQWSSWSSCAPKCGNGTGIETRVRRYKKDRAKKMCEGGHNHPKLYDERICTNLPCVTSPIPGNNHEEEFSDNKEEEELDCTSTAWGRYGPCNRTCGGGYMIRYKKLINENCEQLPLEDNEDVRPCNEKRCAIPDRCYKETHLGHCRNITNKWYFNNEDKQCGYFAYTCGHYDEPNRFESFDECMEICTGYSRDFYEKMKEDKRKDSYGHRTNWNND